MLHLPASVPFAEASRFREGLLTACDVYASVPATVLYSPNYAAGAGGLSVLGKLPLRLSVGVREVPGEERTRVHCGETYVFSPEDQAYVRWQREPVRADLLERAAARLGIRRPLELTTWSDFPFQRGLNADASFATAAAAALVVFSSNDRLAAAHELAAVARNGDAGALRWVPAATTSAEPRDPGDEWAKQSLAARVFDTALNLESEMFHAPADGHFTLGSMLDSQHAVVFCRAPDPIGESQTPELSMDAWFRTNDWWGSQIEHLWPGGIGGSWPVAIALWFVAHGDTADIRGVLGEATFDPHVNPLEHLFSRADRPIYGLSAAAEPPTRALLRAYRGASLACSVRVLQTLKRALTDGSARLAAFCDSQDRCQALLRLLDRSPPAAQRAMTDLAAAAANSSPPVTIGARFQEYGRHGYLLVVGEPVRLREVTEAAQVNVKRRVVHWYYEPEHLATQGLDVRLGRTETVDFRVLRGGKWQRDRAAPRARVVGELLHILVRIDLVAANSSIVWCRADGGYPNALGETYEVLSKALADGETPHPGDTKLELASLPTLGLLLARLSEAEACSVQLVAASSESYEILQIPSGKDGNWTRRDRGSITNALDSGNRLLEAMSGRLLRGTKIKTKFAKGLTVAIEPDVHLAIGVEIVHA